MRLITSKRLGVVRLDQIAGLHQHAPGAAVHRRVDIGVAQCEFRGFDIGLIDLDARRRRRFRRHVLLHLVRRDEPLFRDRRIALDLRMRQIARGGVLRQRRLRLRQSRLSPGAGRWRTTVAPSDLAAIGDVHVEQLAIDEGFHRNASRSPRPCPRPARVRASPFARRARFPPARFHLPARTVFPNTPRVRRKPRAATRRWTSRFGMDSRDAMQRVIIARRCTGQRKDL
jgi:hypothetical protein